MAEVVLGWHLVAAVALSAMAELEGHLVVVAELPFVADFALGLVAVVELAAEQLAMRPFLILVRF